MFRRISGTSQGSLDADGERVHGYVASDSGKRRYVTAIRVKDAIYCFDSTCYHAGGPLGLGDI